MRVCIPDAPRFKVSDASTTPAMNPDSHLTVMLQLPSPRSEYPAALLGPALPTQTQALEMRFGKILLDNLPVGPSQHPPPARLEVRGHLLFLHSTSGPL